MAEIQERKTTAQTNGINIAMKMKLRPQFFAPYSLLSRVPTLSGKNLQLIISMMHTIGTKSSGGYHAGVGKLREQHYPPTDCLHTRAKQEQSLRQALYRLTRLKGSPVTRDESDRVRLSIDESIVKGFNQVGTEGAAFVSIPQALWYELTRETGFTPNFVEVLMLSELFNHGGVVHNTTWRVRNKWSTKLGMTKRQFFRARKHLLDNQLVHEATGQDDETVLTLSETLRQGIEDYQMGRNPSFQLSDYCNSGTEKSGDVLSHGDTKLSHQRYQTVTKRGRTVTHIRKLIRKLIRNSIEKNRDALPDAMRNLFLSLANNTEGNRCDRYHSCYTMLQEINNFPLQLMDTSGALTLLDNYFATQDAEALAHLLNLMEEHDMLKQPRNKQMTVAVDNTESGYADEVDEVEEVRPASGVVAPETGEVLHSPDQVIDETIRKATEDSHKRLEHSIQQAEKRKATRRSSKVAKPSYKVTTKQVNTAMTDATEKMTAGNKYLGHMANTFPLTTKSQAQIRNTQKAMKLSDTDFLEFVTWCTERWPQIRAGDERFQWGDFDAMIIPSFMLVSKRFYQPLYNLMCDHKDNLGTYVAKRDVIRDGKAGRKGNRKDQPMKLRQKKSSVKRKFQQSVKPVSRSAQVLKQTIKTRQAALSGMDKNEKNRWATQHVNKISAKVMKDNNLPAWGFRRSLETAVQSAYKGDMNAVRFLQRCWGDVDQGEWYDLTVEQVADIMTGWTNAWRCREYNQQHGYNVFDMPFEGAVKGWRWAADTRDAVAKGDIKADDATLRKL